MKWIRKTLKCLSLTAAMFVFQACYGTMDDYFDKQITFHVVDDNTGEPMQGVGVWRLYLRDDSTAYGTPNPEKIDTTDENGNSTFWVGFGLEQFTFIDKDSLYTPVDTIIRTDDFDTVNIRMRRVES